MNARVICRTYNRNDLVSFIDLHTSTKCPPHWAADLASMIGDCIDELLPERHIWHPRTGVITGHGASTWNPADGEIEKLMRNAFVAFLERLPRKCPDLETDAMARRNSSP